MKIDGIGGGNSYRIDKTDSEVRSRPKDDTRTGQVDRLELSPDAQRIAKLVQSANALPEIRQERVAELSRAIRRGVYEVEPRALARSILEFEDDLG